MGVGGPGENGDPSGEVHPGEDAGRQEHQRPEQASGQPQHGVTGNGSAAAPSNGSDSAASPWSAAAWEPAAQDTGAPSTAAVAPNRETVPPGAAPGWGPPPGWSPAYTYPHPAPPTPAAPPQPPSPRRPPVRTHRWGLGAYLLAEAVFLLTSVLVGLLVVSAGRPTSAGALAIALAVPTVLAAGVALLITRLRGNGPREDLRLHWSWRQVGLGVAFGAGGLVITIPASVVYVAVVGSDATSAVGEVVGGTTAALPMALLIFLIVVLVAPVCEEIVYRGLLWGGVERLTGPRVAFAVSTLLFALAHFEFTRTPLLLVVAIPIAAARYFTGGLLASIVAHQINNLLPGVVLLLGLLGVLPTG